MSCPGGPLEDEPAGGKVGMYLPFGRFYTCVHPGGARGGRSRKGPCSSKGVACHGELRGESRWSLQHAATTATAHRSAIGADGSEAHVRRRRAERRHLPHRADAE